VKSSWAWPVIFAVAAGLSRWPDLLPSNFSAFYGLAFCAGAFLAGRGGWLLPLGTLLVTDVALSTYYSLKLGLNAFQPYLLVNYAAYAGLILLGRGFGPRAPLWRLVGGGLFGAGLFYLATNTASWLLNPFQNPGYDRTFAGWWLALTQGTAGHPPTLEFFRNTLLSAALFTALFAAVFKAVTEPEPQEAAEPAEEPAKEGRAEEA
jgi:hypothetical protein